MYRKLCNCPLDTECSNIDTFEDDICNECKSELDCFHDVIYDASGKDLNYQELSTEFISLLENLKSLSKKWGLCDTVFRGKVYDLYESKSK